MKNRDGRSARSRRTVVQFVLALALSILFVTNGAYGLTVTNTNGDTSNGSLRWAVANTPAGGTVDFSLTYPNTITLDGTGDIDITQDLTITGPGETNLTVSGNGDRIFDVSGAGVTVAISGLTLTNGSAGEGGAIRNQTSTLTVSNCTITENTASTGDGGGIYNTGTLTVNDCTFTKNEADDYGGGIENDGGSATITDSIFGGDSLSVNTSGIDGGGIGNYNGALQVTRCTFSYNNALQGGGLHSYHNTQAVIIEESTFSSNTASADGGGVNIGQGTTTIQNCTIFDNEATTGDGGGVRKNRTRTATLINCTVSGNTAGDEGGGLYETGGGTLTIENTIVANNSATGSGPDIRGTITSGGYNLVENTSGGTFGTTTGDLTGSDPQLGTLGDWGGPTQTMPLCAAGQTDAGCGAPVSDSPAMDHIPTSSGQCGGAAPYNIDQRSVPRPYNTNCDIGAYERTGSTLVELVYFSADGLEDRVLLNWETASEIDNAGFHLWRSETATGTYSQITDILIPSEGGASQGAIYQYEDADVEPGRTYHYKLEDIDYDGLSTFHGPVSAWVGVVDIKVNGSDGPVVVSPDAPLSVSVDLKPGKYEGQNADLWIAVNTPFATPFDWYAYRDTTGWQPGIQAWTEMSLSDLSSPIEVLNMHLPLGYYTFYFGVDDPDGRATGPWLGLDSVEVEVR